MKFISLDENIYDLTVIKSDYRKALSFYRIRLGLDYLFIKKLFRVYYIPYNKIVRVYRRFLFSSKVLKSCPSESIVLTSKEGELGSVRVHSSSVAQKIIRELKTREYKIDFSCPEKIEANHCPSKILKFQNSEDN